MRENADQNNSEYEHFLRSDNDLRISGSDIITIAYVFDVNKSIYAANELLRTSILWNCAWSLLI